MGLRPYNTTSNLGATYPSFSKPKKSNEELILEELEKTNQTLDKILNYLQHGCC